MKRNIHTLFVPDVHGREFWREPVTKTLEETNAKIVFLGDYVDPYKDDFIEQMNADADFDYHEHAIDVFNDILDLKYKYPNRIVLLIGNHDCGYAISKDVCDSRRDYINANILSEIYKENYDFFKIAYEEKINDIHFVFSHAGISMNFIYDFIDENLKKENVIDFLNNGWLVKNIVIDNIGIYDKFRGWGGVEWASPIWADIRQMSYLTKENTVGDFQIVGHTQIIDNGKPIIFPYIGDFDCRECFYIDEQGNVRNYNNTFIAISADTIKFD